MLDVMKKPVNEGQDVGSIWPQTFAAIVASLAYMCGCMPIGWTSPMLPLLADTQYIVLTPLQSDWVSALISMGAAAGSLTTGYVVHQLGHKYTLMLAAVLYLTGWATVVAARSAIVLCGARLVLGVCIGISFSVTPTYIGEIAHAKIRGSLGSMVQFFSSLGLLFEYVVGPWSSYVMLAASSAVMPAVLLVGMFFVPDSPYQLIRRGKTEDARKAFMWLRGLKHLEGSEFQDIEEEMKHVLEQKTSMKDLVADRATVKALLLSQVLIALQQMSGISAMMVYSQQILGMGVKSVSASLATIIVNTVTQVVAVVTPLVVERAGRRILLMTSATGMGLSQLVLGMFFYCTNTGMDTSKYGSIPIVCLIVFITMFATGLGPVTWAVSGELFAPLVRSRAASFTSCTCWTVCFFLTFFFQNLVNTLGIHVVFWTFAGCCFFAGVFVFFLLPETKGRTFSEIQDLLGA